MNEIPGDLKFMKSHEWARVEDNGTVTVGISDHAQGLLGDLVYVELPSVGDKVQAGNACAVVESVKAASDVYAPVSGEVIAVNSALADKPETINEDAYGEGWIFVVKPSNLAEESEELLDPDAYAEVDRERRALSSQWREQAIERLSARNADRVDVSLPSAQPSRLRFAFKRSRSMPFIPHSESDVRAMLKTIGVQRIEDLFDEIPPALKIDQLKHVPPGLNEMDVTRLMKARAAQDGTPLNFAGAGAYEHHIPAAVWAIVSRGEFYSAYTPYQAEASQGTLQLIYEYQTMMTRLTGMDVSNASLYDGATALAEAVLMAERCVKKGPRNVLVPKSVHPAYRKTLHTIVALQNIEVVEFDFCHEGSDSRRHRAGLAGAAGLRRVHRAGDSAAELLRRARRRRRADRLGAREGRAGDRRGQSAVARRAQAAARVGLDGRRHRLRRRPAVRRAAVVGRSVLRHPRLQAGVRAPDAGTHRRPHHRSRRQGRLRADPAGARAAHPPRQGDLEHLHQPGPARHRGDDHDGDARSRRRAPRRRASMRNTRKLRDQLCAIRRSDAAVRAAVLPRGRIAVCRVPRTTSSSDLRRKTSSPVSRSARNIPQYENALLVCATETKTDADLDRFAQRACARAALIFGLARARA